MNTAGSTVGNAGSTTGKSYASVARVAEPKVRVTGGPAVDIHSSTSFYILPDESRKDTSTSSETTKEKVLKIFKPSEYGLQIDRIAHSRGNGIRIDAITPDLEKVKKNSNLKNAGLKVVNSVKYKSRFIMHDVPDGYDSGRDLRGNYTY